MGRNPKVAFRQYSRFENSDYGNLGGADRYRMFVSSSSVLLGTVMSRQIDIFDLPVEYLGSQLLHMEGASSRAMGGSL